MTHLWKLVGSIAVVVAILFATLNVVMLVAHEEITERTTYPAADIAFVDVSTGNGTIEVTGDDVDEITLVAEVSHGLRRTQHRAEVEGDTLVVRSQCTWVISFWCRAHYRLVVPRDVAVTADSDNGRVALRDLTGAVDADSDNGRIELTRLAGDVRAITHNGTIEASGLEGASVEALTSNGSVRLTFAEAPTTVLARSSNGSVEVTVPEGSGPYRVETGTRVGSTDNSVHTDSQSDASIVATTHYGSVQVRYPTG